MAEETTEVIKARFPRPLVVVAVVLAFVMGYGSATGRTYSMCFNHWSSTYTSAYDALDYQAKRPNEIAERAHDTCIGEVWYLLMPWRSNE